MITLKGWCIARNADDKLLVRPFNPAMPLFSSDLSVVICTANKKQAKEFVKVLSDCRIVRADVLCDITPTVIGEPDLLQGRRF